MGGENSNISNQSISSVLPKTVQLAAGFIILEFVSKKICTRVTLLGPCGLFLLLQTQKCLL